MAETTPNQSEPTENKNADAPKATSGLPPKSPPPPGAGGPPKAPPPPGAGGPPKAPPPPGASAPAAGGPPKAPAPPGAGGPPKAPAPPTAGGPPRTPPPPATGGPPKTPAPPGAGGPPKAPPPVVPNISTADNPLGQVPRPPKTPAPAGTAAAPKPATTVSGSAAAAPATTIGTESTVTRREFLNYVWGASMALFLVQFGGLSFFFALPRARLGEFGGIIPVGIQQFIDAATQKVPIANNAGKFWVVNTDQGINALYKVCTHLGCIYPWSDASNIFACPCHGSQFHLNGDWIAGPAPRSLDRFVMQVQDASGATIAESADGQPIALPANAAQILVDTGKKILGKSHL